MQYFYPVESVVYTPHKYRVNLAVAQQPPRTDRSVNLDSSSGTHRQRHCFDCCGGWHLTVVMFIWWQHCDVVMTRWWSLDCYHLIPPSDDGGRADIIDNNYIYITWNICCWCSCSSSVSTCTLVSMWSSIVVFIMASILCPWDQVMESIQLTSWLHLDNFSPLGINIIKYIHLVITPKLVSQTKGHSYPELYLTSDKNLS